jgi:hypothetical protein
MMQRECAIRISFEELCGRRSKREEIVAFMVCRSQCIPQACLSEFI